MPAQRATAERVPAKGTYTYVTISMIAAQVGLSIRGAQRAARRVGVLPIATAWTGDHFIALYREADVSKFFTGRALHPPRLGRPPMRRSLTIADKKE